MQKIPRPYEIYRHFKGMQYQVLSIATHSETGEQMVVYQQLYAPFGVYVRPLAMFMSKVDKEKYPQIQQEYRFEKVQAPACERNALEISQPTVEQEKSSQQSCVYAENVTEKTEAPKASEMSVSEEDEPALDPGLLKFLEADTYEEKLEILSMLHPRITDAMIDTMAVCLDIEVKNGDIEQRYSEILNCLLTMERFECNRLR